MRLYIVRHGESEGNFYQRHQTDAEKLTKHGIKQAKKVAKRFAHTKVDQIISSTTVRTQQTAHEIAEVTKAPIILDSRFKELHGPSQIQGLQHTDAFAKKVKRIIEKNKDNPDFHYGNEENYFDFIKRVSEGFFDLEKYIDKENIVVVAHGHVLRVLFGLIIFGVEFSSREFDLMMRRIITNNTGITVCEFTPEFGWKLITYNDNAHLLE